MLHILPHVKSATVEDKIRQMRSLKDQLEELQAYYDMLKDEVIIEHFSSCVEYRTANGLLLATYTPIISERFQQSDFKKDHPVMFDDYKKEVTTLTFRLK